MAISMASQINKKGIDELFHNSEEPLLSYRDNAKRNSNKLLHCIVLYCIADAENAKESKNGSPSIKCKSKDRNVRKVKTKVLCKNKVAIQSLD